MANTSGKSILKGRWTIWALSGVFALLAGLGVLIMVGNAAETGTYFVVNQDMPIRTQITSSVLEEKTSNLEGIPVTAVTKQQLESQPLFTLVAMHAGEPVTISNVGTLDPLMEGLPSDYVAASLSIAPENAAGGKIAAGDYVDIAAVSDITGADGVSSTVSKVVLHNVYVIDVSAQPDSIPQAAVDTAPAVTTPGSEGGANNPALHQGIPQLYTFAVNPQDFTTLAILRDNNPYLALSQAQVNELDASTTNTDVFTPGIVGNSGPTASSSAVPSGSATPAPSGSIAPAPSTPASPSGSTTGSSPSAVVPSSSTAPSPVSTPASQSASPSNSSPSASPSSSPSKASPSPSKS